MKELNILVSSAGRRVELIDCFREALQAHDVRGAICAADCSLDAPSMHLADKAWRVPRCDDPDFIPELLNLAVRENIHVIVPTIDGELMPLALHRDTFARENIHVCISAVDTVLVSVDKNATHAWLTGNNFPTVAQTTPEELLSRSSIWKYPLVVKPRCGSGSKGVRYVASADELRLCANGDRDLIVQSLAPGHEYTINVFVTSDGRCVCTVPHRRLEVRSGEVSKASTVKNPVMMALAHQVAETLPGARGALNIQCFLSPDGEIAIIELNARFGGGYPLAHHAGATFTHWLVAEVLGVADRMDYFDAWTDDLWMLRYDQTVFQTGYNIRSADTQQPAAGVGFGRYSLSGAGLCQKRV